MVFCFALVSVWVLIPSCIGWLSLLWMNFAMGEFRYATAVEDNYIRMPDSGKNIHLFRQAAGHEVSFGVHSLMNLEEIAGSQEVMLLK